MLLITLKYKTFSKIQEKNKTILYSINGNGNSPNRKKTAIVLGILDAAAEHVRNLQNRDKNNKLVLPLIKKSNSLKVLLMEYESYTKKVMVKYRVFKYVQELYKKKQSCNKFSHTFKNNLRTIEDNIKFNTNKKGYDNIHKKFERLAKLRIIKEFSKKICKDHENKDKLKTLFQTLSNLLFNNKGGKKRHDNEQFTSMREHFEFLTKKGQEYAKKNVERRRHFQEVQLKAKDKNFALILFEFSYNQFVKNTMRYVYVESYKKLYESYLPAVIYENSVALLFKVIEEKSLTTMFEHHIPFLAQVYLKFFLNLGSVYLVAFLLYKALKQLYRVFVGFLKQIKPVLKQTISIFYLIKTFVIFCYKFNGVTATSCMIVAARFVFIPVILATILNLIFYGEPFYRIHSLRDLVKVLHRLFWIYVFTFASVFIKYSRLNFYWFLLYVRIVLSIRRKEFPQIGDTKPKKK